MPHKLALVKKDDPVTAEHYNLLLCEVNRQQNIYGLNGVRVRRNASGTQLSAESAPQPVLFQVCADTPQDQGYVTALPLDWNGVGYTASTTDDPFNIYDVGALVLGNSPSGSSGTSGSSGGPFPAYGYTGPKLVTNWTKAGFYGGARWDGNRGALIVERVEHVARFINFSYAGDAGESYTFGQPDENLTVLQSWDGLDPTKTSFTPSGGGDPKTNQISLVNSPDGGYTIKVDSSGDAVKGTAVWRDDLDNSTSWQYQVIDAACNNS